MGYFRLYFRKFSSNISKLLLTACQKASLGTLKHDENNDQRMIIGETPMIVSPGRLLKFSF